MAEVQYGISGAFDLAITRGVNTSGDGKRGMAIDGTAEIDGVAPYIHKGTTCERCLQANILRTRWYEGERGSYKLDSANATRMHLF